MYIYVGHLQCYLKNALVEKCLAHSNFICKYFITQHVAVVECILKYLSDQDDFKLVSLYFSSLQIYYNTFFFQTQSKTLRKLYQSNYFNLEIILTRNSFSVSP